VTAPPRRIATVAATGYKAFLYTLEGQPDDKKQSIEKDYMAPIVDDPAAHALRILTGGDKDALNEKMRQAWTAIVDARMRKRAVPEAQRGLAPMTIGLGPNFVAGETVDLAIETMWGDQLGAIIETGATLPLAGEPRPIGGVGRGRANARGASPRAWGRPWLPFACRS
jgi:hypothetical protein